MKGSMLRSREPPLTSLSFVWSPSQGQVFKSGEIFCLSRRESLGSHIPSIMDARRIISCEYLHKQSTSPSDSACLVVREYFPALLSDLAMWCVLVDVLWLEMFKVSTSILAIASFTHSLDLLSLPQEQLVYGGVCLAAEMMLLKTTWSSPESNRSHESSIWVGSKPSLL